MIHGTTYLKKHKLPNYKVRDFARSKIAQQLKKEWHMLKKPYTWYHLTRKWLYAFKKWLSENSTKKKRKLYILKCENYYKIWITYDITARINKLQCWNPFDIKVHSFYDTWKKSSKLEAELHLLFAKKNHKWEWFKLTKSDLAKWLKIIRNASK